MSLLNEVSLAVEKGRNKEIGQLVQQALNENMKAEDILNQGLLKGMDIVGEAFKTNKIFVPEVLIAARAMNVGVDILKPYLLKEEVSHKGTVVLGTVKGDLHDIGKNLVKIMLEGKGLHVVDLGVNVQAERFIEEAKNNNAQIICCSALLTTTMPEMKKVVDLKNEQGLDIKIMVGGAPVTQEFCEQIGADSYTDDASRAASEALRLLEV